MGMVKYAQRRGPRVAFLLRMPEALRVHLSDEALEHGRSLNEEILVKLMTEQERKQAMQRELLALEPAPNDPRSDAEIVEAMEAVYERWQAPTVEDRLRENDDRDGRSDDEVMADISWLNQRGWPFRTLPHQSDGIKTGRPKR